ncbi:hypothetical protein [Streptomyces justiciae]|uniref:hypothetical protein n=2 Tax=Streptomyces justiciae TaxID=2780140 RepID=UPI00187E9C6C|nr:hypothetical protein [Streptomyces justiciae]MBE8469971.1 hypothetical protein [Streptomyces justiciae]
MTSGTTSGMTSPLRLLAAGCAALVCAGAVAGCAGTDGLGAAEPAPAVSVQPRPKAVWHAWSGTSSASPGAAASTRQRPPEALKGLPKVGAKGLEALDVRAVLRADPRMRPLAGLATITRPGDAGLRPPRHVDLTGDGTPELLVAADTESGRTLLAVYTARAGKVYDVLFTGGRQVAVETLGHDLLLRSVCADGAQQAVRFHWDGERLSTVTDEKKYGSRLPYGVTELPTPAHSRDSAS